ncbi:MAG: CHASE2 domain-containing protein [Scytolyngbya sp. HA4215-MV1]|jgi:CHASE2 domain-containing sensor protein/class 3 adenylate cyclase|nr:CHASE2 domain-containing protein [Scytolyngbya sp. HA4215-MV1]
MDHKLQDSIVVITSGDSSNHHLGTGFVIHQEQALTYILTCARVVKDLGGRSAIVVEDMSATVIALGEPDGVNLAVLQVPGLGHHPPLQLVPMAEAGDPVTIAGFDSSLDSLPYQELPGVLGQLIVVTLQPQTELVGFWGLDLAEENRLTPGDRGAPIVNSQNQVYGVVVEGQMGSKSGWAICITALPKIWTEMPSHLLPAPAPESPAATAAPTMPSDSMVTIVFTDLVGSTALKKHLPGSDISVRNRIYFDTILRPHRQKVEAELEEYGGRVVKTEGDAYFLVFASAANAARWAVSMQKSHLQDPITTPLGALRVKVGMHTGTPLQDGTDFIGHEVDFAARITSVTQGGEILLSEVTAVLVRGAQITGLAIAYRGERDLKGIGTVPVFELVYGGKSVQGPIGQPPPPPTSQNLSGAVLAPDPPGLAFDTAISEVSKLVRRPPGRRLQLLMLWATVATATVMGLRTLGILQPLELKAYDQMLALRPPEPVDSRLLVVAFTETDVQTLNEPSLSDQNLLKVLKTLEAHEPVAIGLDLYRDVPIGKGQAELLQHLKTSDLIVSTCKVPDLDDRLGVAPPPGYPTDHAGQNTVLGFSNAAFDPHGVLRRHYLSQTSPPAAACLPDYALNAQLAFRYLYSQKNIQPEFLNDSTLKLGATQLHRLPNRAGGYQKFDASGFQLLLNYRLPAVAEQITINDVLSGRLKPESVRNRVILIGVDREDIDRVITPDGSSIAGVLSQAQGLSQILSAVLDHRPLLSPWAIGWEILWVWGWAIAGGAIVCYLRRWLVPLGGVTIVLISGMSFIFFVVLGNWVPLVPTVLACILTGGGMTTYQVKQGNDERT